MRIVKPDIRHFSVADSWERDQLASLCSECKTWEEFGLLFVSRGFVWSMRAQTLTQVAVLVACKPPPKEEPAAVPDGKETPESTSTVRRGERSR